MQKTAQKRSVLNKLKEMTNVSGLAAEKFFNPEFKKVMESLRAKDDQIRSIVAGETIGEGDPGSDPVGLKDLLKSSKSNLNRREYMSTVAELGRFHKKLFDVVSEIKSLETDVDAVHHEFLFKDLGEDQKKHLQDLKSRFAKAQRNEFIKEASIMDFFYNIGTKRGRALAAWEKRYPKQVGKLKKDTDVLQERSEALLSIVLSTLKEMASARADRNIDNYVKAADKIVKSYQNYDKIFKDFYTSNVKGFLEKIELISPVEKVNDAKQIGNQELPVETKQNTDPAPAPNMSSVPAESNQFNINPLSTTEAPLPKPPIVPNIDVPLDSAAPMPLVNKNTIPAPPPNMSSIPASEEGLKSDQIAKEMWGAKAHQRFYNSLEKLSNEDPIILSSFINKYAKSIQFNDTNTSIKLFKIAKSIKG